MAEQTEHARQPERLSLSATQIIASVLAAISASVAASYFGIAGTMIGAAIGSVISVVGGAVYAHSISKNQAASSAHRPRRSGRAAIRCQAQTELAA